MVAGMLTACDSIDCTLNNTVMCNMSFYNAQGKTVVLLDTLTIRAIGTDSVLYNRAVNTSQISLPLSYYNEADTLLFDFFGEGYRIEDRLVVKKKNYERFESLDCPVKMFHTLTDVLTTQHLIDSVHIASPKVEYNNGENIKIYLHTDR